MKKNYNYFSLYKQIIIFLFLKKMNDIIIKETNCFGMIHENSISYDDIDYFGNSLVLLDLYKIKCYVKMNRGIVGIQLTYKYKENNKEFKSIDVKRDCECFEQEFIFKPEEKITNIIIFRKEYLQGFEITTNLKRIYRFGLDDGEKVMLNEFYSGKYFVIGFYTKFDNINGMTAIGFYYIDKKQYLLFLSLGLFLLRTKLNNDQFSNSIKINNLDYENKAILKTCRLPKNNFLGILKYIVN